MSKNYKNKEWLNEQYIILEKSAYQIAKECNVCDSTIRYWLRIFFIKIRTTSESMKISQNRPETKKKISEALKGVNNYMFGKHHSEEAKRKMSEVRLGKKNPNWKGDLAKDKSKYNRIHNIVRRLKPKPNKCEDCGKETSDLDLSFNNFHKDANPIYYTENPNDYTYRCAECHRKYDKRIAPNQSITLGSFL